MTTITYDPNNKHSHIDEATIDELVGILQYWVVATLEDSDLIKGLEDKYGFGKLYHMNGGVVDEDGAYSYPEDPTLHPIMKLERTNETAYIYYHAIVSIVYKDGRKPFISRMD